MATFCGPQFRRDGYRLLRSECSDGAFNNGYMSHIRGRGSGLYPHTHVFPGTMQVGNESGANGPIYVSNPDVGNIIEIKRNYDGLPGYYHIYRR